MFDFNLKEIFGVIVLFIVILVIIFIGDFLDNYNATDEDKFDFTLTTDELLQEFKENDLESNVKYENKIIKLTGTIDTIEGDNDEIKIVLTDDILGYRVVLIFTDKSEIKDISSLISGDYIEVVGEFTEYDEQLLTNAVIIEKCNYID